MVSLARFPRVAREWTLRARCRYDDRDALFTGGAKQHLAKRICYGCPVITECLADALDNRIEYGVWGGRTERERRSMLRRNPTVKSWLPLLNATIFEKAVG